MINKDVREGEFVWGLYIKKKGGNPTAISVIVLYCCYLLLRKMLRVRARKRKRERERERDNKGKEK